MPSKRFSTPSARNKIGVIATPFRILAKWRAELGIWLCKLLAKDRPVRPGHGSIPTGVHRFRTPFGDCDVSSPPERFFIKRTFKGNRANRRPISFKDSTAFVSMGCFLVNSTQTSDVAKKRG
jgi:hypothetical protein